VRQRARAQLCLQSRLGAIVPYQKDGNVEGVSVQIEGSYETDVVDGSWLKIYPEGQDLQIHRAARTDIAAWGTHVGSVDVTARMRLLTDSGPYVRAGASAGVQAVIRITAPPGTEVELVDCHGLLKYSRAWYFMRGSGRFGIR